MKKPDSAQVKTEADEASWWFENRAEVRTDMLTASRSGTRATGVAARLAQKIEKETSEQVTQQPVEQLQ